MQFRFKEGAQPAEEGNIVFEMFVLQGLNGFFFLTHGKEGEGTEVAGELIGRLFLDACFKTGKRPGESLHVIIQDSQEEKNGGVLRGGVSGIEELFLRLFPFPILSQSPGIGDNNSGITRTQFALRVKKKSQGFHNCDQEREFAFPYLVVVSKHKGDFRNPIGKYRQMNQEVIGTGKTISGDDPVAIFFQGFSYKTRAIRPIPAGIIPHIRKAEKKGEKKPRTAVICGA